MVDVEFAERYWYPHEGGELWLAGYFVVDPDSGRFLARAAPELAARGLLIAAVAGAARHHAAALDLDAAAPGRPLALRRDRDNPHDANAIAVQLGSGEQVGWVPRGLASELAVDIDARRPWSALALREQRPSPREPRSGLTMLLAASAELELNRL